MYEVSNIKTNSNWTQEKNIISCNYGKENSLEISGFLASVTVEGIDGDIFCSAKNLWRASVYVWESTKNQQNNELRKVATISIWNDVKD
jgi:hypothetical protein